MASEYRVGNNYCVVGPVSQVRTWVASKDGAVEHAKTLMRNQNNCDELLVVKVVARVRKATPPIEVINVK